MDGYSCACIKHGWIGLQCSSWKPFDVSTYEELGEAQRNVNSYDEKRVNTIEDSYKNATVKPN
jgi:hypothetical protein